MNNFMTIVRVVAIITILSFSVVGFVCTIFGPVSSIEQTEDKPWMTYKDGKYKWNEYTNLEAFEQLFRDRIKTGYSFNGTTYMVYLGDEEDDYSRKELLEIVKEIKSKIPEEFKYEIEVQTLIEAIEYKVKYIKEIQEEIKVLLENNEESINDWFLEQEE